MPEYPLYSKRQRATSFTLYHKEGSIPHGEPLWVLEATYSIPRIIALVLILLYTYVVRI